MTSEKEQTYGNTAALQDNRSNLQRAFENACSITGAVLGSVASLAAIFVGDANPWVTSLIPAGYFLGKIAGKIAADHYADKNPELFGPKP